jgi:dCMP deaminase
LDAGCEIVDGPRVRTLPAEQNAIIQAALHGVSLEGGTIYTTHQPCATCAKMIINAGMTRVAYAGHYPDALAMKYLKMADVQVDYFDLGERTPAPPPSMVR